MCKFVGNATCRLLDWRNGLTMHSELSGLRRNRSGWMADEFQEFTKLCLWNDRIGGDMRCEAMWLLFFIGKPLLPHEYVFQLKGSLSIRDIYLLGEGIPTTRCEGGAVHIRWPSMLLTNSFLACLLVCLNLPREPEAFLLFCLPRRKWDKYVEDRAFQY